MAEEGAFDEGADAGLLFGVELFEGLEVVGDAVGDGALCFVEDEQICADVEGDGEAAEDVEGGLAGAGFVAAELADVDADGVGEHGLGVSSLLAEGRDSGSEAHGEQVGDICEQRTALLLGA